MKTRFFMKLCLFSLLVWCVSSCKSDNGDSVLSHWQMPRTCKKLSKNCKQVFLKVWLATLFYSMK